MIRVYMAKFHRDEQLQHTACLPEWLTPVQAGAALTEERVAQVLDNTGKNISHKNPNYCELTVLYWMWKNALSSDICTDILYYGLFHYRRWLDIREGDISRMTDQDVDAVLPYPTIHEPDIREHHARYIKKSDWDAALRALEELEPAYYAAYDAVFSQEYLYNYNIIIAKKKLINEYCNWLFPILERIEDLSDPEGSGRADRYIGYIGENLLTLYFTYHKNDLNIAHTGRIMLT